MEAVIWVSPDGAIHQLYDEKLDFSPLGEVEITRATDVRYNNEKKGWEIYLIREGLLAPVLFHTRSQALQWEKTYLETRGPNGC